MKQNKYEIDMCNGTIMDKLISFSLPLMLSGILQLMFNAVDIIVVGRFSGSQALAAVGSTTALINVFTNLFIGISLGANVLAARFYAAGKDREMSDTVHTAVTLALVSGIVMAFVGLIFSRWALELMGTPDDVIGQAALYMKIYFLGMPFFMLYNCRRYETSTDLSGYFRCCKCSTESDPRDHVSYGCGGRSHCYCDLPVNFLHSGTQMSAYIENQLPASFWKIKDQYCLLKTDFPGWDSGRDPEHSH